MFCPSCGAENKDPGQRYCRECGASLPSAVTRAQVVVRDAGKSSLPFQPQHKQTALVDASLKNRALIGAVGLVVLVGVLYIVVKLVIATITAVLLPLSVVAAIAIIGYYYLRGLRRR